MNLPLVSICIPTYNGALYLQEALNSIVAQSYKNIEVIISDDNSKDNTLTIAQDFKNRVDFPVIIVSHVPQGIGANWNNTIKHASGIFIKFLFQDDVLQPTCIEKMISIYDAHPDLGLVACKRDFIISGSQTEETKKWIDKYKNLQFQFEKSDTITIIDKSLFKREDFLESPLNKIGEPPTVLFKKTIVDNVGYFDESLKQILDYVFYYRILKIKKIAIINEPLVLFRLHEKQASQVNSKVVINDYKEYDKILYKEFLSLLNTSQRDRLKKMFSSHYVFKQKVIKKLKFIFSKKVVNKK